MQSFLMVVIEVIGLYRWMLIISWILSLLVAFNIVNSRNQLVAAVGDLLARLTEPALRPLRKIIPLVNGVDLSPLALYFLLYFLQILISNNLAALVSL